MNSICVVVTINENYVQHLGVMLNSIAHNTNSGVVVYVLHGGLSKVSLDRLSDFEAKSDCLTIKYIKVRNEEVEKLFTRAHFPSACYYRLLLPALLPESIEKVIYLDPDLVVLEDISLLWNIDLSDWWVAAVEVRFSRHEEIGLAPKAPYFCSGVMIFNVVAWRNESLERRSLELAKKLDSALKCPDQDVLNILCYKKWLKLPLKWDKTTDFYLCANQQPYGREDLLEAKEDTGIIHYTGARKPWHISCSHPKRRYYWKYLAGTPWEGARYENKSVSQILIGMLPFKIQDRVLGWLYGRLK